MVYTLPRYFLCRRWYPFSVVIFLHIIYGELFFLGISHHFLYVCYRIKVFTTMYSIHDMRQSVRIEMGHPSSTECHLLLIIEAHYKTALWVSLTLTYFYTMSSFMEGMSPLLVTWGYSLVHQYYIHSSLRLTSGGVWIKAKTRSSFQKKCWYMLLFINIYCHWYTVILTYWPLIYCLNSACISMILYSCCYYIGGIIASFLIHTTQHSIHSLISLIP